MAFVSGLVLFCLYCLASDVVELEPVQTGTYDCNVLSGAACTASPYCHWANTNPQSCIDDPCLNFVDDSTTSCGGKNVGDLSIGCTLQNVATTADCGGGKNKLCRSEDGIASSYDYCFLANLRDGASNCPSSVCKFDANKKCVAYNVGSALTGCQFLSTENDCKLVPKCLWRGSSGCVQDPCFFGSEGFPCGTWKPSTNPWSGNALVDGDCVLFQPYKANGQVASYCVYKDNKSPNLCYFLNGNSTARDNSPTDYNLAYPTYNPTASPPQNPLCTSGGTIAGCDDNGSGQCSTKLNVKGGLAGLYCGDADHGAANVLHIPSLIVFLIITIFVSMFTS